MSQNLATDDGDATMIMSAGPCYVSVCTREGTSREVIERHVNARYPTGLDHGWSISDEPFRTGQPNPCPCDQAAGRLHFLLSC